MDDAVAEKTTELTISLKKSRKHACRRAFFILPTFSVIGARSICSDLGAVSGVSGEGFRVSVRWLDLVSIFESAAASSFSQFVLLWDSPGDDCSFILRSKIE